ncbi:MAG: S1C family serine protease [Minisyncoccia bacterium]
MESLNKQQLILLALLVSFVTSIATGIVTVALMNQAPQTAIQTINRVVEKTIETVVSAPATTTTRTIQTVVVTVDDQIVEAVDKNKDSVVRLYMIKTSEVDTQNYNVFFGLGALVSSDGIIATDNNFVIDGGKYLASLADGKMHTLDLMYSSSTNPVALFKVSDMATSSKLSKFTLDSKDVKLGQTVILVGGQSKNSVSVGIVSSLGVDNSDLQSASTPSVNIVSYIQTNFPQSNLLAGSPIFNLSGDLVGIKTIIPSNDMMNLFAPVSFVKSALAEYSKK